MTMNETDLRREIGLLGVMLGETITACAGEASLETVERLRRAAWDRRVGRPEADDRMREIIAGLSFEQLRTVIRAFTIFLDLFNLVEDRRRIRVLSQRAADAYPYPPPESIGAAVTELKNAGLTADQVRQLLDRLHIELVFTAHPTEAKRRSVRSKLRRIRNRLTENDSDPPPHRRDEISGDLRANILKLWQTDFIRPHRPTVSQEVARGLSVKPVLWRIVPQINRELETAIASAYGDAAEVKFPPVTFGSWIGGDRDGHPGVTTDVTESTMMWLRREAVALHLGTCDELFDSLSISVDLGATSGNVDAATADVDAASADVDTATAGQGDALASIVDRWIERHEVLGRRLDGLPGGEVFRRYLSIIRWRLEQTAADCGGATRAYVDPDLASSHIAVADGPVVGEAVYQSCDELLSDIAALRQSVAALPGHELIVGEVDRWMHQTRTFGLHLARLDIRQNASVFLEVVSALAQIDPDGDAFDFAAADADRRRDWLVERLSGDAVTPPTEMFERDDMVGETLRLFRLMCRLVDRGGQSAIGTMIISMTASAADVLSVLWLWRLAAAAVRAQDSRAGGDSGASGGASDPIMPPPIVPLLETIEDLKNGPDILRQMLSTPIYREHVAGHDDHQLIMLGYSDSTKDGGYLSACWSLHRAQRRLVELAEQHGVRVSFFHGRGGSLGRGGGPAARGIQSLPEGTFRGRLRITEQGEVLAQRYDDPTIAHRHLEQMVGSSLIAAAENLPDFTRDPAPDSDVGGRHVDRAAEYALMDQIADDSLATYRALLESPDFIRFFRSATPISEIEQLPIGSRPSRRKPDGGLSDLRAIPWVFSWTQSRCLIPAWYGVGTALGSHVADPDTLATLQRMYSRWPFFRATIENAELALAKADMKIARRYADLAAELDIDDAIQDRVAGEYRLSVSAILAIKRQDELLEHTAWLKESIRVRNRFIDPLNFIQIELLRRRMHASDSMTDEEADQLQHLVRLSINGIASGMRTSG